jgi:hypothetical protein
MTPVSAIMSGFKISISLTSTPPFAWLTSSFAPLKRLELRLVNELVEWLSALDDVLFKDFGELILVCRFELFLWCFGRTARFKGFDPERLERVIGRCKDGIGSRALELIGHARRFDCAREGVDLELAGAAHLPHCLYDFRGPGRRGDRPERDGY